MPPNPAEVKQAELLRNDGNNYFKKSCFGAAIDAYTQAITCCLNIPIYYTNRALCHLKRNEWERVEEDSRRAIQLDSNSVKAHYMLGLALLQKQELPKGIRELEKETNFIGDISESEGFVDDATTSHLKRLEAIERVFNKAAEDDIPAVVSLVLLL